MKSLKISLLGWILIGLTLVGLLPFAITAYQINASREGLIEQVQQTHLVAVLSTADRVGAYLELLNSIAESAAKNPNLYNDPTSNSAQELLIGILRSRNDLVASGIVQIQPDKINLIQNAQSKEHREAVQAAFATQNKYPFQLTKTGNKQWLLVTHPIGFENLYIRLLAKRNNFASLLTPKELEEADIGIFTRPGQRLAGVLGSISEFSPAFKDQVKSRHISSSADFFNFSDGTRGVAAFAEVPNTNWVAVSRQPASKAEVATRLLKRQALVAFGFVIFLAALLALAAKKRIIQPLRELISAQQQLAGIDLGEFQGSEIEQLKVAFAQLEQNVNDRKALNKTFLGRYQVVEVIASGAMGTVFIGHDPRLERPVALKTIKIGELSKDFNREQLAKQLVNEAKLIAKIAHPNIITIYDAVDAGESALVAMEYVEGVSLADYIKLQPNISVDSIIALAVAMLNGLAAAHQVGIIHRDIKPGNILLGYDGSIKVTDFGIAELLNVANRANESKVFGTPGYIAPELLEGGNYSKRTDLFAIGVLLYRLSTKQHPFFKKSLKQTLIATANHNPPTPISINANIPLSLSNVIMYLLQKDPTLRPKDADVISEVLEKEFGITKWDPPLGKSVHKVDPSTTAETRILPETIIRKHIRSIDADSNL